MDERAWALRAAVEQAPRGALEIAHVTAILRSAREDGMSLLAQGEWRSVVDSVASWADHAPSARDKATVLCELADVAAARLDDPERAARWYVQSLSLAPLQPSVVERATLYLTRLGAPLALAQVLRAHAALIETAAERTEEQGTTDGLSGSPARARPRPGFGRPGVHGQDGGPTGREEEGESGSPTATQLATSVAWSTRIALRTRLSRWLVAQSEPLLDRARRAAPVLLVPFDQRPTRVRRPSSGSQPRPDAGQAYAPCDDGTLEGPSPFAIVGWMLCLLGMFTLQGDPPVDLRPDVLHVAAQVSPAPRPAAVRTAAQRESPRSAQPKAAPEPLPVQFSLARASIKIPIAQLGPRDVERTISQVFDAARSCPLRLGRGEPLAVDIVEVVRPSGRVARVSARGIPERERAFETCLEELLRDTRYPAGDRAVARIRARLTLTR